MLGFLGYLLALLIAVLVGHAVYPPTPPTEEEAMGTYRLDSPLDLSHPVVPPATLRLNGDGNWEYVLERPEGAFRKTGRWTHVRQFDSESALAIELSGFELGFKRYPDDRLRPSNFFLNLEGNKETRSCLDVVGHRLCFVKQKS
jgi:hypothetical protein